MNFADRLAASISRANSFIVAGFDPQLETFPETILNDAAQTTQTEEDFVYTALTSFYLLALEALTPHIAAVKPNIAFFEQYGLGGLRAFGTVCQAAREHRLPVIADAKRGDIGSTAQAYSRAFLGKSEVMGRKIATWEVDSVTVNPFMGFDTIAPFIEDCVAHQKGIFVLVKTSNPGSGDIQGIQALDTKLDISTAVAQWLDREGRRLIGECGFSSLGAVVGAPYPDEAKRLRELMPRNLFLIPGMGAQGGTAADAVAGFGTTPTGAPHGALINLSRGLLSAFSSRAIPRESLRHELIANAQQTNRAIAAALTDLR
jgi:orotidine-5'-phosphate decarboxylase